MREVRRHGVDEDDVECRAEAVNPEVTVGEEMGPRQLVLQSPSGELDVVTGGEQRRVEVEPVVVVGLEVRHEVDAATERAAPEVEHAHVGAQAAGDDVVELQPADDVPHAADHPAVGTAPQFVVVEDPVVRTEHHVANRCRSPRPCSRTVASSSARPRSSDHAGRYPISSAAAVVSQPAARTSPRR